MTSLEQVRRASAQLAEETERLDVHADAAALQFVVDDRAGGGSDDGGGYTDLVNPTSDAASVQDLLLDGQREHVALHVLTQKELSRAAVCAFSSSCFCGCTTRSVQVEMVMYWIG